jgi:Fe-S oxidoreductase
VYHDPCYLGRYRGVYDEPRNVIAQFAEPIDPSVHASAHFVAARAADWRFLGEEKGKRVSVERAEQLAATGAGVVGAACPFCNTMLPRCAVRSGRGTAPKLLDIAQIAAAGLPKKESGVRIR